MNYNIMMTRPFFNSSQQKCPEDGKMYWVFNVSKDQANWTQRNAQYSYTNNEFTRNSHHFCNVTMQAMNLIYSGIYARFQNNIDKIYPELPRLPDKLAKFIFESKEIRDYYKLRLPGMYQGFERGDKNALSPTEVHNVLSYATNIFVKSPVTFFSTVTSWEDMFNDIIFRGTPVGVSGVFSGLHHMVSMVGVAYKKLNDLNIPDRNSAPSYIIVDDPYGKTYEYEKRLSGNDIWIPFDNCVRDFKDKGSQSFKFAHRYIRPNLLGI